INEALSQASRRYKKKSNGGGFIPYITAGDPDLNTTSASIIELARAGATVIELGVPFSDPMADGPVIQRASERALKDNCSLAEILDMVRSVRRESDVPIVLFSYFNPLLQFGLAKLSSACVKAGIDGILITDLAPEEAGEVDSLLLKNGLDLIFLVAPTSSDERLQMISARARGFIYAISRTGVTGTRATIPDDARCLVGRVRRFSTLPVAVGFGISSKTQVREVWEFADAAVVGSAIVAEIERLSDNGNSGAPSQTPLQLAKQVGDFARQLTGG
ncbi:MAG: tryptophan synthase subunit alpha, partial [Pyrinomonadaceae bacterium]